MAEGASDFNGQKVLITGGGGYVGQRLGNALLEKGADVILFDVNFPQDSYAPMTCIQVLNRRPRPGQSYYGPLFQLTCSLYQNILMCSKGLGG